MPLTVSGGPLVYGNGGATLSSGTAPPTAATTGFGPGSLFTDTAGGRVYVNTGTASAPVWLALATVLPDPPVTFTYQPPGSAPYTFIDNYNGGYTGFGRTAPGSLDFTVSAKSIWAVKLQLSDIITWNTCGCADNDNFVAAIDGNDAADFYFYPSVTANPGYLHSEGYVVLTPGTHTITFQYLLTAGWTLQTYSELVISAWEVGLVP